MNPSNQNPLSEHRINSICSDALIAAHWSYTSRDRARSAIDIFAAAGLKKPDISILSDEFLADVKGMPQKNLGVELLRKLLEGEIKTRSRKNVVQARSFTEMLEKAITKYRNRAIETAAVIEEMIALAREMREAQQRSVKTRWPSMTPWR